jgi:cell division protease FtsH
MGIGRSRVKVYMERQTCVRFDGVVGVDEAKGEQPEIVDFLKDPKAHGRLGTRIPEGVLPMSPTGTGKTMLARAVAGEAGVAFFSINRGHDEREQTLNQLLSELDGFDPSVGVVLLAATNRPEVLAPPLLSAGCFG